MRILVVDDDEMAVEMLKETLTAQGHAVEVAYDGAAALETMRRNPCRLVISDWEMPVMSGLELCRAIRAGDFSSYVYVILLTGHNKADEIVAGLSAGADDFVTKPFNPEELVVRVATGERVLGLESRDIVLFSMAKLAESRDPETGKHLERMRNYCKIVAQHLCDNPSTQYEVDRPFVRNLFQTSPLHDIGKIGIPDCVLLKPGRLSDHEFEIMKMHTTLGAETLESSLENFPNALFLRMARDIALGHHERWDGSGYPRRLAGMDVPLAARIAAIADVYDALTSKRVYKSAMAHDVARSIIIQETGTHFDPRIVKAFIDCEKEFVATREQFWEESQEAPAAVGRPQPVA